MLSRRICFTDINVLSLAIIYIYYFSSRTVHIELIKYLRNNNCNMLFRLIANTAFVEFYSYYF